MPDVLTASDVRHWAVLTRALLAAHRTEIDRLNVFPVPDGDTGTNLFMSFDAALESIAAERPERAGAEGGEASLATELGRLAQTLLLTARGNSGVILSQLVRGFADVVIDARADLLDADLVTRATRRGYEQAWGSVARPQEGTILTVARDVAEAAEAHHGLPLPELLPVCLEAATASLRRTPELLPALADAGVVDAGGAGYVLVVEALDRVVRGELPEERPWLTAAARPDRWATPAGGTAVPTDPTPGPAYEVMFLLDDSATDRVEAMRATLDGLGDSLLVVGGPDLWNVHVHVDDPGAAVEAGVVAGRPHRIRIQHFAGQLSGDQVEVGVVACAAGPGIATLLADAGAVVVASGPGQRASTGQLLAAARATHARSVVILPNDRDTQMAAQAAAQAAREDGVAVHVVPSRTVVQGLAALAVFDPGASAGDNAVAMAEAAAATRHGAVTVAAREGLTSAGHCQPGDVLGAVDGDFAVIGDDIGTVAQEVLGRLLLGGGELVTIVVGEDAPADLADRLRSALHAEHRGLELVEIDGGQPHYPVLLGVE